MLIAPSHLVKLKYLNNCHFLPKFLIDIYNVAKMRVNPTHADTTVCPTPQNRAQRGCIGYVAALYTKATTALLTIPDVIGGKMPISKINTGKNFPNLCFLNVKKAINAAIVCTKIDENKAQRKT